MTIDILICTIDEGVGSVGQVLMPPMPEVHYVVSMQHTRPLDEITEWDQNVQALRQRADVTITTLEGRGLSRNRNNALAHATGDILVIADDDCRYSPEAIAAIREAFAAHPDAAIVCFEAESYDGTPLKHYPSDPMSYADACQHGYYAASVELAFRRSALLQHALQFDERFGLGAEFPASEEEVMLCDAERAGLRIDFVPQIIVRTDPATTGSRFLHDHRLQQTKGILFRYRYGLCSALWRTLKEGAYHLCRHRANPLPIYYNMLRGMFHNPLR